MKTPLEAKLLTADAAMALIRDSQTIATGGFIGAGVPEALLAAMERRFLGQATPRNLTLVYAAGQGDARTRGANHFAHAGMVKRVIGGHWGMAPKLGKMAIEGAIEAYNFPQGVICQLFRDIAAGRPGCITHVGLHTFVDPELQGGRMNDRTPAELVERVELNGRTWLLYKAFPIHVGLIRATAADRAGNLIMDGEVFFGEMLPIAQAARNSGGIVVAQVSRLLDEPIGPQLVKVPGIFIDHIVVAEPHEHEQTFGEHFNAGYCSAPPQHGEEALAPPGLPLDERRIIAARACDEIPAASIVNLGIGMPEGIGQIAVERGWHDRFTMTIESGPIGGVPARGLSFGASLYPQAVLDQPSMFDFYDGRGLDFAALGLAQVDASGDVNVSKFGPRLSGVGGFVNISQTAKRLVFCGTFTAGKLAVTVEHGRLVIVEEGTIRKFVRQVEQISFSARRAREIGQPVLFVTERAVFRLAAEGLELIEVAPGIDIDRQILSLMDFKPMMRNVKPMPEHVFRKANGEPA